jgi:hypothetical protein
MKCSKCGAEIGPQDGFAIRDLDGLVECDPCTGGLCNGEVDRIEVRRFTQRVARRARSGKRP